MDCSWRNNGSSMDCDHYPKYLGCFAAAETLLSLQPLKKKLSIYPQYDQGTLGRLTPRTQLCFGHELNTPVRDLSPCNGMHQRNGDQRISVTKIWENSTHQQIINIGSVHINSYHIMQSDIDKTLPCVPSCHCRLQTWSPALTSKISEKLHSKP